MVIALDNHWIEVKDGDPRAVGLYRKHYSCHGYNHGQPIDYVRYGFSGKGESLVLLTKDCRALFCWRKVEPEGIYCSVFHRDAGILASELILEAEQLALQKWPDNKRFYTHVDPKKVHSSNPGYCFLKAGWRKCGITKKGLIIWEKLP